MLKRLLLAAVTFAVAACASPDAPGSASSPSADPGGRDALQSAPALLTPSVLLTPQPTVTPRPPGTDVDRRATALMWQLWTYERGFALDAVRNAGALGHKGLVPALIEVAGLTFDQASEDAVGEALFQLTGESFGGGYKTVARWYGWLGAQPVVAPVEGYDGWKGHIYGSIASGLDEFLYDNVPARVPTWSVQWGGVGKDGIRPLEDPRIVPAREAAYMEPDEIVLGIVVNGEARAYPKRFMNVHELANDIVGGKPVAVVM